MDVDLVVSDQLSADVVDAIEAEFRALGLSPTVRLLPPRRGAELTWFVLATLPLFSFLDTLGSKLAEDVFEGLRGLVQRVLRGRTTAASNARTLILQDAKTQTQVVLDPDLSIEGYRALLTSDLAASSGATLRYDQTQHAWIVS